MGALVLLAYLVALSFGWLVDGLDENTDEPTTARPVENGSVATTEPRSAHGLLDYDIVEIEDASDGEMKRYVYHVAVWSSISHDSLRTIVELVVDSAKNHTPFNAVRIGLYDHPWYVGHGFTLGSADFAPEGGWEAAASVSTRDYSAMSFTWNLYDKGSAERLWSEEVEVWAAWESERAARAGGEAADSLSSSDDAQLYADIADEFDMSAEEVRDIVERQRIWVSAQ